MACLGVACYFECIKIIFRLLRILINAAAAVSWTGWAVSSLTSKFYKSPQSQALPTSSGSVTTTKSMVEERQKEAKVATEEEDPVRGTF